ncbi:MAG: hypothetical protein ACOC3C_07560 [Candidatus Thorarchaeota archaeon]
MTKINKTKNWTNLVVFVQEETWIGTLIDIWKRTNGFIPRYYEIRCRRQYRGKLCIGLDLRFFSPEPIEDSLVALMREIGVDPEYYDINPKQRTDKKAKIFEKCSGSYRETKIDRKHTPEFLEFLTKVSDLAVEFLSNITLMTSSDPKSEEPRNEVSHLFRIMMGIQDGLDFDVINNKYIKYTSLIPMQ